MSFGRLERTQSSKPMSDINMTPLVDVMLVLVVIFIITAPLMTSAIKLDLPKTEAAKPVDAPKFVTIVVDKSGQIFLNDQVTSLAQLNRFPLKNRTNQQRHRSSAACRRSCALWQSG